MRPVPAHATKREARGKGELQPMPIIETSFERKAMDLVWPLPKGKGGYQYILVIIDYATRYPEAVPLRSTKAPVLAVELVKVFSRMGFPKDVLADQGTNFWGEVMQEIWSQLGVKHLHTVVFHPQTNGLCERFNKTLKMLLRRFATEDLRGWPKLLEPVLFAVREVSQASTGYSPFELLFGRRPRGILDLARRQWEGERSGGTKKKTLDLGSLRERLLNLSSWAQENLKQAQTMQRKSYNKKVKPKEFQPGEEVLLLLPTSETKLWSKWRGPYKVIRRVTSVDYEINMPD